MAKNAARQQQQVAAIHCAHTEVVDIDSLVPNPRNPNRHSDEQLRLLAKIMAHQGWRNPIVVSARSGFVVKGHGRLAAARLNRWEHVPIDRQAYADEATEWADMVADNRIAELAELDADDTLALMAELGEDFDRELLGYDEAGMEDLQALAEAKRDDDDAENSEEDDAPALPQKPVTQIGDLWLLGPHRLLCGDAHNQAAVNRVTDGHQTAIVVTDPPYGINIVKNGMVGHDFGIAKKGKYQPIANDARPPDVAFLLQKAAVVVIWGGNYFADQLPASNSWLVWDKRCDSGIENSFADCEMAWSNYGGPARIHRQLWNGMIRKGEHEKRTHPTQKPVALMAWCIGFASPGAVLDPYLGSGTTLIAAETLNRPCYGLELEPGYCDVIVARWEKHTGKKAKRA